MTTRSSIDQIAFRYRPIDSKTGVSRDTEIGRAHV